MRTSSLAPSAAVLLALGSCAMSGTDPATSGALTCGRATDATCPGSDVCVDHPDDDCDPARGDHDCVGTCEEHAPPFCDDDDDDPMRSILDRDPDHCFGVRFACPLGTTRFDDGCGCGCAGPHICRVMALCAIDHHWSATACRCLPDDEPAGVERDADRDDRPDADILIHRL